MQRVVGGSIYVATQLQTKQSNHNSNSLTNQFVLKCSVRGHHTYKRIWTPQVGERLETFCQEDNEHDKYAVAVHLENCATVVGHIFIKNKGDITGEVSGRRRHFTAACGGVEVPCLLTFYHRDTRVVQKAKVQVTRKFVIA